MHSSNANTVYRIRAMRSNGSWHLAANKVQGSFSDVHIVRDLPIPISDFINSADGNLMRLEIRNSTPNRAGGFFRHYTDLAQWELTP